MLPPQAASLDEAHAAIDLWEHYKRRTLDPSQRLAVEVIMACRTDGLWAAPTTGREMPRQNGKGDEIEVVELWGLVQRAERILHTVHDAVLLASQSQSRLLSLIEGHRDLDRLKKRAWLGTGQQMIEMRNGGAIWYRTRTGGGARGVDEVDRVVIDEAQHAEREHLAALSPTTLASVNPQLNAMGSAGIEGKSGWWWEQRIRALSADPGDYGYVGHTADMIELVGDGVRQSPIDPTDRALWRAANPALIAGRTDEAWLEEQYRRLGPHLFAREHLGVWDSPPAGAGAGLIPNWAELVDDPPSSIVGDPVLALDVSPDRRWACLGAAGRNGGGSFHVEAFDRRPGTSWVLDACVALWEAQGKPIRIESGSPAWSFEPLLREAGVEVVAVSTAEHGQALGTLMDAARDGRLRHLAGTVLDAAVGGAEVRVSQSGASYLARRSSKVDISPLVAVTLALGGVPAQEQARDIALSVW